MNIAKFIIENNLPHTIDSDGNVVQKGILRLQGKNITSLKGFKQTNSLFLSDNNITSLEGFIQNGSLYLRNNKITSLKGFKQNGDLYICKWVTIFENNKLSIGCKTKTLEEWRIFFENKESYETNSDSDEYKLIEKTFKMYYEKFAQNKN